MQRLLLCKKQSDSFALTGDNDDDHDGAASGMDSMFCKWRSDSFHNTDAVVVLQEGARTDLDGYELETFVASPSSSKSMQEKNLRVERRQEVAYLEALAAHANKQEPSQPSSSTSPGRKLWKTRERVQKIRSLTSSSHAVNLGVFSSNAEHDVERLEAMAMISREAAIRETIEREMQNACAPVPHTMPPSVSRARGRVQPLRLCSRPSFNPQYQVSLNAQQPDMAANRTAQRSASFGIERVQQARENTHLVAHNFQAAATFSQSPSPKPLPLLVGQRESLIGAAITKRPASMDSFRVNPTLSASNSAASFDMYKMAQRSCPSKDNHHLVANGFQAAATFSQAPNSPRSRPIGELENLVGTTVKRPASADSIRVQRTSLASNRAVSFDFGKIAQRSSPSTTSRCAKSPTSWNRTAHEVIDSLRVDRSVLGEAKHLTELDRLRQAQQNQQPTNSTQNRSHSDRVFWQPPPQAAQLCAKCPSLDGDLRAQGFQYLPVTGVRSSSPSLSSFTLSELAPRDVLVIPQSPMQSI